MAPVDAEPKPSALMVATQRAAHQLLDRPLVLDDPIALTIQQLSHLDPGRAKPTLSCEPHRRTAHRCGTRASEPGNRLTVRGRPRIRETRHVKGLDSLQRHGFATVVDCCQKHRCGNMNANIPVGMSRSPNGNSGARHHRSGFRPWGVVRWLRRSDVPTPPQVSRTVIRWADDKQSNQLPGLQRPARTIRLRGGVDWRQPEPGKRIEKAPFLS